MPCMNLNISAMARWDRLFFYGLRMVWSEHDFCHAVRRPVPENPDKKYIIICDGLNTHKSESLVLLVAELCHLPDAFGTKGKKGILKILKNREKFLMDEGHRVRFMYAPKHRHSSWVNQIEIWFGIINRKLLKKSSYKSIEGLTRSI